MIEASDNRIAFLLLSPLFGSIAAYLAGRISERIAGVLASCAVFFSFIVTCSLWSELQPNSSFALSLGTWIATDHLSLPFGFVFDRLSAVMCLVITGIGTLIHIYSVGYMAHDESRPRFFSYLNLFVAAMLTLVLGSSLPVLFVGWEGVGLCSYLLIGFWFTNPEFAKAGRKAFVMNRIGDLGLMVAMFALFAATGTLDIKALNTAENLAKIGPAVGCLAGLGLFVAATGKSAQIPLFTWLPDAMAGPTPVSALIHAATMVTAGIYLMGRMYGVIELDPFVPALVCWIALGTAFLAATTAIAQNDIKKVLAYSTVSQLGFMFLAVGAGEYAVALFHVVTHAFFKACLFLSAGSVIYGCHHEQDMRKMGGLSSYMPATCIAYGISTLAIAGIWPFAGFFSKHAILDGLALSQNPYLLPWLSCIGWGAKVVALLTALYMTRSFVMTFMGKYRGGASAHPHHSEGDNKAVDTHSHTPHEAPLVMVAPVLFLALLSVGGGYYLSHSFLPYLTGTGVGGGVLPLSKMGSDHELGFSGILSGSLPGVIGIGLGVVLFHVATALKDSLRRPAGLFEWLFAGKYYVDEIYDAVIVAPLTFTSGVVARALDKGIVDGGVNAVGRISEVSGELVRRATTGQVATYVVMMFVAASVFLGLFVQK
jgi:NADH-quinone oxidoreductase subunit L